MDAQVRQIPQRYPIRQGTLGAVDIAVRAKLLKAHLQDAFVDGRFSVRIIRKASATPDTMRVSHDTIDPETVRMITELYLEDAIAVYRYCTEFGPGNPPDDPV